MLFIYILFAVSKLILTNQTNYFTDVLSDSPIKIPKHCYILGYPMATNSSDCVGKFTLFKPIRKMHEYEYDIERGIELASNIRDRVAVPDFSAQALGLGLGAILLTLLYKLFA